MITNHSPLPIVILFYQYIALSHPRDILIFWFISVATEKAGIQLKLAEVVLRLGY